MSSAPLLCVSASREWTDAAVADGPRRDYLELARQTNAEILYRPNITVDRGWSGRLWGAHIRQAWTAAGRRGAPADAVFADGEHIGLPLLLFQVLRRSRARVTFIGHLPARRWKRPLIWLATRLRRNGTIVVHSRVQQRVVRSLVPASWRVEFVPYQVDTDYWAPVSDDPGELLVVAAGAENRDYDCLIEAAKALPATVRVVIAGGSHWARRSTRFQDVPPNVTLLTESLGFGAMRELYSRAAVVVVPLEEVTNQSGVTTLLEGMAMAKPVIVSANRGQLEYVRGPLLGRDGSVDAASTADRGPATAGEAPEASGIWGIYVPVGDPFALARGLQSILDCPRWGRSLGQYGCRAAVEHFSIERYATHLQRLLASPLPAGRPRVPA